MTHYIGEIFEGTYPPEAAVWCNTQGNCYIKEIEKQGDTRRFQITAIPEPTDAEVAARVRAERDSRIDAIEWRVDRYKDQLALGIQTTDTAEQYTAVLTYMQALRDVPSQSGFPRNVVWPSVPNLS